VEAEPRAVHRAGSLQWAGLAAVAIAAIVADQVTKRAIERRLALDESHRVLPFLSITHVRNDGIAFGIFPGKLAIVSLLTAAAVLWMLVHFARSGSRHVLFPVALGLLVGGSVSNLADRLRDGHVTDFIHVSHWPTFNLADSFIVVGVALLALGLIRVEHQAGAAPSDADRPPELELP
jgi:signal peptidase II